MVVFFKNGSMVPLDLKRCYYVVKEELWSSQESQQQGVRLPLLQQFILLRNCSDGRNLLPTFAFARGLQNAGAQAGCVEGSVCLCVTTDLLVCSRCNTLERSLDGGVCVSGWIDSAFTVRIGSSGARITVSSFLPASQNRLFTQLEGQSSPSVRFYFHFN